MLQFSKALRAPDEAWQAETGLMAVLLHTKPLNDNLTSSAARQHTAAHKEPLFAHLLCHQHKPMNPSAQSHHGEDCPASSWHRTTHRSRLTDSGCCAA